MINEHRLINTFMEMLLINSPSKMEKELAAYITAYLRNIGLEVREDQAGTMIGGNCGNLFCFVPATDVSLQPLLFCAHLDTIRPTEGISILNDGEFISTDGTTILGADDKAGIAVILELITVVKDFNISHGGLEIVFTVAEETGLEGAKLLDYGAFRSKLGFVLDSGDKVGSYVVWAPSEVDLEITVQGKPAHASIEPEKGINAIHCAAKALANLPMGKIDENTTFNIGIISGGTMTNIIPERVMLKGEIRSLHKQQIIEMSQKIESAFAQVDREMGAKTRLVSNEAYAGFDLRSADYLHEQLVLAGKKIGLEVYPVQRGGGSDANIFNAHGICVTNLGLGMQNEHNGSERVSKKDLIKAAHFACALLTV